MKEEEPKETMPDLKTKKETPDLKNQKRWAQEPHAGQTQTWKRQFAIPRQNFKRQHTPIMHALLSSIRFSSFPLSSIFKGT